MIWPHAARALRRRRAAQLSLPRRKPGFNSSFWIMRFSGRGPNCGSKPVSLMCSISSSLGIRWMSFSSSLRISMCSCSFTISRTSQRLVLPAALFGIQLSGVDQMSCIYSIVDHQDTPAHRSLITDDLTMVHTCSQIRQESFRHLKS